MRLINTSTKLFEEFIGVNLPKYAILSHTWEQEEVSFQAMTQNLTSSRMKGNRKIEMTCRMALQAGYTYAWVDTCCIDKSSSAELTEAINSMYRWYQRSEICYVFISDLPSSASLEDALQRCRWFTRGWTLQELIAPRNIIFFDQDWNSIGSKLDLMDRLTRITGISKGILDGSESLSSVAVARKMSWAAHRETTRTEDTSYCLLGIFDVNMPLLYGEEDKAFRRLQEEIIKSTPDFSIFAWRTPASAPAPENTRISTKCIFCGLLAGSPLDFAESASISRLQSQDWRDFSISNSGVKTQAQILSEPISGKPGYRYVLPLHCSWAPNVSLGVRLRKCGPDQFVREDPWGLVEYSEPLWPNAPRVRYLLTELPQVMISPSVQSLDTKHLIARTRSHVLQIQRPIGIEIYDAWSWGRYDDQDQVFFICGDNAWDAAALRLSITYTTRNGDKLDFEGMFYAVGWSSLHISQLQCTMINYQSSSAALIEAQSQISAWDHDRQQVLEVLAHHGIPKVSAAAFKIPGTKTTVLVSFEPILVSDPSICQNKFWKVRFSYKVYYSSRVPVIRCDKWDLA